MFPPMKWWFRMNEGDFFLLGADFFLLGGDFPSQRPLFLTRCYFFRLSGNFFWLGRDFFRLWADLLESFKKKNHYVCTLYNRPSVLLYAGTWRQHNYDSRTGHNESFLGPQRLIDLSKSRKQTDLKPDQKRNLFLMSRNLCTKFGSNRVTYVEMHRHTYIQYKHAIQKKTIERGKTNTTKFELANRKRVERMAQWWLRVTHKTC